MARQDVLVVKEIFMLDGAYVQKGNVIADADKMARASAQHPEKLIPAVHDVAVQTPVDARPAPAAAPGPVTVGQAGAPASRVFPSP